MNTIYSFDIFDTCLCRSCGDPLFVFDIVAQKVLGDDVERTQINDFVQIRINGEEGARKKYISELHEDVTFDEIYQECDFSSLTTLGNEIIQKVELETESECLIKIRENYKRVLDIHKKGSSIIYISDMYLPSTFLRTMLAREGFWEEGDTIIVSCEYGKTKETGNLYDYVRDLLHIKNAKWIHIGDNLTSDHKIPEKKGIKTLKYRSQRTYYNQLYLKHEISTTNLNITKFANILHSTSLSYNKTPYVAFAVDFIAANFVPYVYSIMQDAEARGIDNLYFLARDGYLFYQIAKEFKYNFPSININYLYVSRDSLYLPGLKDVTRQSLIDCFEESVLERYTLCEILRRLHVDYLNFPDAINYKGIKAIDYLYSNDKFVQSVNHEYETQKKLLIDYFRQEGLLKGKSAIVDISGTRKCQYRINEILTRNGHASVFAYYWEGLEDRIHGVDYKSHFFYEKQRRNRVIYNKGPQNVWEEYFCITNHSRTYAYQQNKNNSRIEPIFEKDPQSDDFKNKIFEVNRTVCTTVAQHFINNKLGCSSENLVDIAMVVYSDFVKYPKSYYLNVFHGFRISDSSIKSELLFPPFRFRYLRRRIWFNAYLIYSFPKFENIILFILKAGRFVKQRINN